MRIKKIQLFNGYKRFQNLTIDLGQDPKRIVALIGPNGCGKSSVFDGFLYYMNSELLIGNKSRKNHEYHSMYQEFKPDWQGVMIELAEGQLQNSINERRKNAIGNTVFSFRSPYRYNSDLKIKESRATDKISYNNYGASTTSDIDDKMDNNYRRLYVKYRKYLEETDCKPSEAKRKIIGDLNSALKRCLSLEIHSMGDIDAGKGTLYFIKEDHPSEFDYNVLSSGEKEVVDILLDLYLRQDDYSDSIFLIDEPELHINSAIQRKLLIEINTLIGQNCQIWIATHSIGFLRALQEELNDQSQVIYFPPDVKWASTNQVLKPIKKTRAKCMELFKTALDDLTGLISPRRIIYCEGKGKPGSQREELGLDAKAFNNIFSEKYPETLFVSSGGNTELDQRSEIALTILTKVFSDIEIFVLKDRDISSGVITTMNDRELYLQNNLDNHRVLRRREIENYLFDKEVLKCYCSENATNFNEAEYDNFVTDIENQNIKDETARIKKWCGINTSINKEKFKLTLSMYLRNYMLVYMELEKCIFEVE